MAVEHDSYRCHMYPHRNPHQYPTHQTANIHTYSGDIGVRCYSIGFPTQRKEEDNNFVAAVVAEGGGRLWKKCPRKCRRKDHPDWEHC